MNSRQETLIIKEFGKKLQKLRLNKGLSLSDLAHLADIDRSSIHRMEKGITNPKLTMVLSLAVALGVPPADLLPSS